MKQRTTMLQAEREGLAAIAEARLNPPKPDVDTDSKRHARELARRLGHEIGRITPKGASAQLIGRCRKCGTAVVFRDDVIANEATGDFFGGSAVTNECRS